MRMGRLRLLLRRISSIDDWMIMQLIVYGMLGVWDQ
jgi:hypothetical protein